MAGALFARGRSNERDITSAVAAGGKLFAVTDASTYFAIGDLIFVSEADGTEVEYLGAVASVSTSDVTSTFSLAEAKAINGKIWKPANKISISGTFGAPEDRKLDRGNIVQRTLAGTIYSMDVSESIERFDLKVLGLTPLEFDSLLAWLDTTTGGGRNTFTIIHLDRNLEVVRLTGNSETLVRASGGRSSAQLPVISEGRAVFA